MLKLVTDSIHQPVTLFLPTDGAMAALAQEQKDFLYALHNRDKLAEYLRYHIMHDNKVFLDTLCFYDLHIQYCARSSALKYFKLVFYISL